MKNYSAGHGRLRILLVGLLTLILLVIVLDSLSVPQEISQQIHTETLLADMLTDTLAPETTAVIALPSTEEITTVPESAETTALPETIVPVETAPTPANDPDLAVLTFLGACSPGSPMGTNAYGSLNAAAQSKGNSFFLSGLKDFLHTDDLTLAVNTCIFTDHAVNSSLTCAAPSSQAEFYSAGSVEFISLASPLFTQTSEEYRSDTKRALEEKALTCAEQDAISYLEIDGIRIAVYSTVVEKGGDPAADLKAIQTASKEADYVVVYFWSSDTISSTPEDWLRYALHQLAEAGASLIIGTGEGVLRPVEQYKGTTIAYSLGSLVNGASFRTDTVSVLLQLSLKKQEDGALVSEVRLIPCSVSDSRWQPIPIPDGKEKAEIDAFLAGDSELPLTYQ